ncbi:hypothetical protein [uncultured Enterovirga sp.]|uniref:hypothetical protein n=1 Tax=uncultured Enterovirga sp. TaxID=2026352 RepID=UPI0035C9FDF2
MPAAAATRGSAKSCSDELGPKGAASLVGQCRQVSLASRPPCNAEYRCGLIRDEIHRSCALLGAEAPAFCRAHVGEEEDDEDETEN